MASSGLSEKIRLLVKEQYVHPALKLGSERLSIRVKDILTDMAGDASARGRTPVICEVLQGAKLLRENDLEIERVEGPPSKQSTTVVVHYRILHPGRQAEGEDSVAESPETPRERARRLANGMIGLLKDELGQYGGGEAFLRWVRSGEVA